MEQWSNDIESASIEQPKLKTQKQQSNVIAASSGRPLRLNFSQCILGSCTTLAMLVISCFVLAYVAGPKFLTPRRYERREDSINEQNLIQRNQLAQVRNGASGGLFRVIPLDTMGAGSSHQNLAPDRSSMPPSIDSLARFLVGGDGEAQVEEEKVEKYAGPGEAAGVAMLVTALTLFCCGTFGSIIVGNIWLARNAKFQAISPDVIGDASPASIS